MQIEQLSAVDLVSQISDGQLKASQCVEHFLDRIRSQNEGNGAFLTQCDESALAEAEAIDANIAAGKSVGPLAGLPVAIKDGICTAGIKTTAGSKMLSQFVPPYDATIIERLKEDGAIVIGKTNMDEFAMGSSNENSAYYPVKNPWNRDHVPGGSSGGSAAAVSATMAPVAIGSDTGGSIRQPASFCGITGLKPTYGRVSRFGLIAFASSLDQIGPMTRSAKDCALLLQTLAGHDGRDSTSAQEDVPDYFTNLDKPLAGLKVGICKQHFEEGLSDEVRVSVNEGIDVLKSLGASCQEIQLPHTKYGIASYYVIAPCEASSNLSRYDGVRYTNRSVATGLEEMYSKTRSEFFGEEVKQRILLGTHALSSGYYDAYYIQASKMRRLIKNDFTAAFEAVDVIVGPTAPTTAFKLGQHDADPLAAYLADIYTVSANLAGVPAISLPCGFDSTGLPIGMQLQGRRFQEATLLQTAHQFQTQTDWHQRSPQS